MTTGWRPTSYPGVYTGTLVRPTIPCPEQNARTVGGKGGDHVLNDADVLC